MNPNLALPVPRDITLPMPMDAGFLEILLVILFLFHILFVNLMLGGSTLTLFYEMVGLKRPEYDRLAREIGKTITVSKSLAVVLGVGPLLAINVLYTIHFYSANALTGVAWISIVPLVSVAFLITYLHKYTWDRLAANKGLHIAIGAMGTGLFCLVPLIFLANINLMLFPERWGEVRGFLSALVLPNVLPRYLHFLLASLALTGLAGVGWFGRREFAVDSLLPGFTRPALRRKFYSITFGATLLQIVVGSLVYFTLPVKGITVFMTAIVLMAIVAAIVLMGLLWKEILAPDQRVGRLYAPIFLLLTFTVSCMAYGRHLYREGCVAEHRRLVAASTLEFEQISAAAASGLVAEDTSVPLGPKVYKTICSGCHAVDKPLVGPPLTEIALIYAGNPAGIVKWAKAPGKKRAGVPPMPPFASLPANQLEAVAQYMLEQGTSGSSKPTSPATPPKQSSPAKARL